MSCFMISSLISTINCLAKSNQTSFCEITQNHPFTRPQICKHWFWATSQKVMSLDLERHFLPSSQFWHFGPNLWLRNEWSNCVSRFCPFCCQWTFRNTHTNSADQIWSILQSYRTFKAKCSEAQTNQGFDLAHWAQTKWGYSASV
jgi:hypothetical protein